MFVPIAARSSKTEVLRLHLQALLMVKNKLARLLLILVPGFLIQTAMAQREPGRDYGRSVVISRGGIVATSQTLASASRRRYFAPRR